MLNCMIAQLILFILHLYQAISIIMFIYNFKCACDANSIEESTEILVFNNFLKKTTSVVLTTRLGYKKCLSEDVIERNNRNVENVFTSFRISVAHSRHMQKHS